MLSTPTEGNGVWARLGTAALLVASCETGVVVEPPVSS